MAAKHSSHDFSLLTGAHLSLRLSLLDRSRCAEGDLMEAVAIVPKSGIIAGGRGHDRRALAALEQASCGSSSSSSRRLPFAPSWRRRRTATSWPEFVEHASSEAGRLAIVTSWANMGLASMRGRLCEGREARSEVAGHLLD